MHGERKKRKRKKEQRKKNKLTVRVSSGIFSPTKVIDTLNLSIHNLNKFFKGTSLTMERNCNFIELPVGVYARVVK